MQELASDNGMAPITGSNRQASGDVGGLIAAVESKMAELMAWHGQQSKQLEADKAVHETQVEKDQNALKAQRADLEVERKQLNALRELLDTRTTNLDREKKLLAERSDQIDQQRIKLVELTSKLRAEESAMSREWSDVQRERESIERQAADLAKQRERIAERTKTWLNDTAKDLSQSLKLADTGPSSESQNLEAA